MTAQPQPVPDAALTAALGGYYHHPTAITDADPDVVDGLTAGLAAGLAEARKDERATVANEIDAYAKKLCGLATAKVLHRLADWVRGVR